MTGLQALQKYQISVYRYVGGLGGIFTGFNISRPKLGNWDHKFTADKNGMARETFQDPFTKFNDYNSILGRSIVISLVSNGAHVLHGVVGRLKELSTLDYVAAPIDKAIVHFDRISLTSGTHGWLIISERGNSRHYNYSLSGLGANTKYNLLIGQTGDLFSLYDKKPNKMLSKVSATAAGLQITTKANGAVAATGTINQKINGADSILGKLIILERDTSKEYVGVGVLGIEQDNMAFKPTQIRCDLCPKPPTPRPTYMKAQTKSPTESKGIKRMSVLSSWSFVVIVYVLSNNGLFF